MRKRVKLWSAFAAIAAVAVVALTAGSAMASTTDSCIELGPGPIGAQRASPPHRSET
jgi:hypothetical protein